MAGFRRRACAGSRRGSISVRGDAATAGVSCMRRLAVGFLLLVLIGGVAARAADAGSGQRVVHARCASCHAVFMREQRKLAEALPLETVARKYDFNADALAFALLDPHPRMNEPLTRREAQDVAAYIITLAR